MGPSTPPAADNRPDPGAPRYFDPVSANAVVEEDTEVADVPEALAADTEERGVARAQMASLLAVAGIGLALLGPFLMVLLLGLSLPFLGTLFGAAVLTIALLELLLGLVVAGAALQIISFGLYTSSFGSLRKVDARFRAPRTLSVIGLVGFLMLLLSVGALLGFVFEAVSCAASGSGTACLDPSLVQLSVILLLLGSVLAFVGWIGLLLGLYRLGSRYESPLLKVSAILMIIPLANLVAPILAFVALRTVPKRFDLRASTQGGETQG